MYALEKNQDSGMISNEEISYSCNIELLDGL